MKRGVVVSILAYYDGEPSSVPAIETFFCFVVFVFLCYFLSVSVSFSFFYLFYFLQEFHCIPFRILILISYVVQSYTGIFVSFGGQIAMLRCRLVQW